MPTNIENAVVTMTDRFESMACGMNLFTNDGVGLRRLRAVLRRSAACSSAIARCCFLQMEIC